MCFIFKSICLDQRGQLNRILVQWIIIGEFRESEKLFQYLQNFRSNKINGKIWMQKLRKWRKETVVSVCVYENTDAVRREGQK